MSSRPKIVAVRDMDYGYARMLMNAARESKGDGDYRRKLCHDTYLSWRIGESEDLCIIYHNSVIVVMSGVGTFHCYARNYYTKTTMERLKWFTPLKLYQKDYKWFVHDGGKKDIPFFEGIMCNSKGIVLNANKAPKEAPEAVRRLEYTRR